MYTPLPAEVFEGKGKQWDVYRAVKGAAADDWAGYHPITNVMVSSAYPRSVRLCEILATLALGS